MYEEGVANMYAVRLQICNALSKKSVNCKETVIFPYKKKEFRFTQGSFHLLYSYWEEYTK